MLQPMSCSCSPLRTVVNDLKGRLPTSFSGNKQAVMAVYHLSSFSKTTALPTRCANEVGTFSVRQIELQHGAPPVLLDDRNLSVLLILDEMMKAQNAFQKTAYFYYPQIDSPKRFTRPFPLWLLRTYKPTTWNGTPSCHSPASLTTYPWEVLP